MVNPFQANVLILKTPENQSSLMFSGGIKWKDWPEMG